MSERILIFDTTLRDGEQSPGATMNLAEKIRLAKQLELLGVDIIEAGFPAASQGDFDSVAAIAKAVSHIQVAGLARATKEDIDKAWGAVKHAKHPRIHLFLATSALHMEYKLRKTPDEVIAQIRDAVSHAASYTKNVEFSTEDGARSDREFLVRACIAAVESGAITLNIPDTVGYTQPEEFAVLIQYAVEEVRKHPKGKDVVFSVHCHNDLGLAVANTLAAFKAGARQAEVTVGGIGERAGNACLEELAMNLLVRKDYYAFTTGIVTEQIYPTARLLSRIIGQPIPLNKPIVGANAFAHESGIHQDGVLKHRSTYEIMDPATIGLSSNALVMGKHSGRRALTSKLEGLGYNLNAEQTDIVFEAMKKLADVKKNIYDEDVEALVLEEVYRIPDKYRLVHLSVQASDTGVPPTAMVVLDVAGETKQHAGFGVGPIDAVFNAISVLVGRACKLEQYQVNAITGGADAQGEVTVRLSENGNNAVGRGSHPDVINASARAYINALNRLAKKQEER